MLLILAIHMNTSHQVTLVSQLDTLCRYISYLGTSPYSSDVPVFLPVINKNQY